MECARLLQCLLRDPRSSCAFLRNAFCCFAVFELRFEQPFQEFKLAFLLAVQE